MGELETWQRCPRILLDLRPSADNALQLTNDLRYESKDSREIGNGSMSDSLSLVPIEVPEGLERLGQKPFFSGGDGYRRVSEGRKRDDSKDIYWQIYPTIVDNYHLISQIS